MSQAKADSVGALEGAPRDASAEIPNDGPEASEEALRQKPSDAPGEPSENESSRSEPDEREDSEREDGERDPDESERGEDEGGEHEGGEHEPKTREASDKVATKKSRFRLPRFEAGPAHPLAVIARSVLIGSLIGAALVVWAQFSFGKGWADAFLRGNQLEMPQRMTLLYTMLFGAFGGAVLSSGALGFARYKRVGIATVERWHWFLAPLILLPALPMLFRYRPWASRYEELLPIVLLFVLFTETAVYQSLLKTPEPVSRAVDWLRHKFPDWARRHAPTLIVVGAALAYAAFMSFYTIRWHHKLGTANYDLGINDGLMYMALHGEFNYSTIVFPEDPSKYIANHAKLGALVFLPIYALFPRAETLLVIQSVTLGLSALPLYAFAKRRLSPWMSAVIALCWLCYYPLQAANFYEVKFVPIAAFFILSTIWAVDAKRWVLFGLAFLIAALMREDMPVGLAVAGLFLLVSGHRPIAGLMMAVVCTGWFAFLRFHVMNEAGDWWFPNMYKDLWAPGEKGFTSVIKTLLTNPMFTLTHVIVKKKVIYLLHLLVPLAFLPGRRWYLWAAFIPGGLLTLLITDYDPVISFSFQYVMHWAPYLFVAAVLALAAIASEQGIQRCRAALTGMAIASAILTYNYGAFARRNTFKSGYHKISFDYSDAERQRYRDLREIIAHIPQEASVASTERIGPHVSSRRRHYSLRRGTHGVEYIIARKRGLRLGRTRPSVAEALKSGEYGVYKRIGSFALLKKGHDTAGNEQLLLDWKLKSKSKSKSSSKSKSTETAGQPEQPAEQDELDPADIEEDAAGNLEKAGPTLESEQ